MTLTTVADALDRVLAGTFPLEPENVGVGFALDRTLARALDARLTNPPFNASAMDGYALRAADCVPGARLRVTATSAAGSPFDGTLQDGDAVRIFTGAVVPRGADAVLIQEDTERDGETIVCRASVPVGVNIRPKGLDFARGDHLLDRGTRLCPRTILLAVAAGHATLPVTRKPRVAVLATGNELVEPGATLDDGQIVGSNSYGIAAMVEAAGGTAQILGIAGDSEAKIDEAIRAANTADILLTSGGASVGDHDLVRPALQHAGANLVLYKVAMRPGKPMFYGTRMSAGRLQRCLGLPGNPVSAMIVARIFLVPLMRALLGQPVEDAAVQVRLAVALPGNGPRDHYIRAKLDRSMNPPTATPMANQDSSLIATLARADCLLRIPAGSPPLAAGAHVDALHIDF